MRSFLSELGCLPVSAMIHIPKAHEVFDEHGKVVCHADEQRWDSYAMRGLEQMMWWSEAATHHRQRQIPWELSKAFKSDPSQRNAP